MTDLVTQIENRKIAITGRVLKEMYKNPFWRERFGERGWQFAEQDGQSHITYLIGALRFQIPSILTNYARWLQTVLTTRGMCSRHLAENFSRLADAIRAEGIAEIELAVTYLRAAEDALVYADGPAREIQLAAESLANRAIETLETSHPDWFGGQGEAGRAHCRDDLLYHLSYLADAIALNRPDLFASYTRWLVEFLARRNIPAEHVAAALDALDEALIIVSDEIRRVASGVLQVGRAAVSDVRL